MESALLTYINIIDIIENKSNNSFILLNIFVSLGYVKRR
jgi:hypothetical protein